MHARTHLHAPATGKSGCPQICMVIKFWKSAVAAAAVQLEAASVPFAMVWFLGALPGRHATVGDIVFKVLSYELAEIELNMRYITSKKFSRQGFCGI